MNNSNFHALYSRILENNIYAVIVDEVLTFEQYSALFDALKENTSVRILKICRTNEDDEDPDTISITDSISTLVAEKIAELFTANKTITSLTLGEMKISLSGAKKIVAALSLNNTLESFSFTNDEINAAEFNHLIKTHPALTTLHLAGNNLDTNEIISVLRYNTQLSSVDCGFSRIDSLIVNNILDKKLEIKSKLEKHAFASIELRNNLQMNANQQIVSSEEYVPVSVPSLLEISFSAISKTIGEDKNVLNAISSILPLELSAPLADAFERTANETSQNRLNLFYSETAETDNVNDNAIKTIGVFQIKKK